MKIIITISLLVIIGLTGCSVYEENVGTAMEITALDRKLDFNGKEFDTKYTDDNTGEELIISSDKQIYGGWDTIVSTFSIENTTDNDETVKIEIISDDIEEILAIKEFRKDIEYQKEVNVYDRVEHNCDGGWVENSGNEGNFYECGEEVRYCNSVNKNICVIDSEYVGAEMVSNYIDEWHNLADDTYLIPANSIRFFQADIRVGKSSQGKFNIKASNKNVSGLLDPWWDTDWGFKQKLTINNTEVSTTTDFFVVTVTSTQAVLKSVGNGGNVELSSGDDIVFINSDEDTVLNYEQELYNETTGEIVYHINTAISSTTDQDIYMYYGNSGASDQSTTTGVWTEDYGAVYHLPDVNDSTRYANTLTANGTASTTADGWIDGAFSLDGNSDSLNVSDNASFDTPAFSVSFWVNLNAVTTNDQIIGHYTTGGNQRKWRMAVRDNGTTMRFQYSDNGTNNAQVDTTVTDMSAGWVYFTAVYDDSDYMLYDSGVQIDQNTISIVDSSTADLTIGNLQGSTQWLNGFVDNVRLQNHAITDGDILTTYNNQSAVQEFFTFGGEEEVPTGGGSPAGNILFHIQSGEANIRSGELLIR